jgi:hypothetical protein
VNCLLPSPCSRHLTRGNTRMQAVPLVGRAHRWPAEPTLADGCTPSHIRSINTCEIWPLGDVKHPKASACGNLCQLDTNIEWHSYHAHTKAQVVFSTRCYGDRTVRALAYSSRFLASRDVRDTTNRTGRILLVVNSLRTEFHQNYIHIFSPYLTGNTSRLHYRAQPVNAVCGNSRCLL